MSDYQPRTPSPVPELHSIGYRDIEVVLRHSWADFRRAPMISLYFGSTIAFAGLAMIAILSAFRQPWMILPLAIGFPLVGPFLAAGTYEVSRKLNQGEPLVLGEIFRFMWNRRRREFSWMAFVVLFIFWIWMYQARILMALFLDMQAFGSATAFLTEIFTTASGLQMAALGSVTGGVLAFVLFASTVIAMPLLVEHEVDVVTAIITSWQGVLNNLGPMLIWGALVAALTFCSAMMLFIPLCVVFPVLGFATWRLYKRVVRREIG